MPWFRRSSSASDLPAVALTFRGALKPAPGYDTLVSVGMSLDGPVAVWSSEKGNKELHGHDQKDGFATFPRSETVNPPQVALTRHSQDGAILSVLEVEELGLAHPIVDVLLDGAWLIVGSRCYWRKEGPEHNARVISSDGDVLRTGCVGDGINHVQVGPDGTIWIGYFDEGVYGNYGWGNPDPKPLGAGGVVAWTENLVPRWNLNNERWLVDDCYALNAGPEGILVCPYVDWPLVRIAGDVVEVFETTGLAGPSGVVASANQVAHVRSYDDPALIVFGEVVDGAYRETSRGQLSLPGGPLLPTPNAIHCRGSAIHIFVGQEWYTYDLAGN